MISSEVLAALNVVDYVAGKFRDNIPTIMDEVTVEVVGQPGASKNELYYLAMAAAFGMARRIQPLLQLNPFLPPSAASLMIEYDAADHWVRCTLVFRSAAIRDAGIRAASTLPSIPTSVTSTALTAFSIIVPGGSVVSAIIDLIPDPGFYNGAVVYRGPQCDVIGGKFDFVDLLLPGVPSGVGAGAPTLPWTGKTILTGCPTVPDPRPIPAMTDLPPASPALIAPGAAIPSPNPKPSGDNRSRGSVVVPVTGAGASISGGASGTIPIGSGTVGRSFLPSTSTRGAGKPCCPKTTLLVELVAAALTDPGSNALETWLPPVAGPSGAAGGAVGG